MMLSTANMRCSAELTLGGLCVRFLQLNFVSRRDVAPMLRPRLWAVPGPPAARREPASISLYGILVRWAQGKQALLGAEEQA
jgi:hypothetical protein